MDPTYASRSILLYLILLLAVPTWFLLRLQKIAAAKIPRIGKNPHRLFGIARARDDFLHNGRSLVEDGYAKYKDSKYVVQTADMERIILSNKYIDELRNLPTSTLDNIAAQCDRHLGWWNTLDVVKHSSLHADVCRYQLNNNLGPVVLNIASEARHSIEAQFTQLLSGQTDCTNQAAYPLAMRIVTHTVNRALVGLPLCRDDSWIQTTMDFATNAFVISATLRPRSIFTRPLIYYFLSARLKLKESRKTADKLLIPLIERLQRDETSNDERSTLLYWMMKSAKGCDRDPRELVHKSLFLSLASVQSSILAITNFIYDICAYPEYTEPLRREIDEAVAFHGGWNVKALYAMQKLDSFLKESQRLNHPGLFSFNRKVMKRVDLSDGTHLPAGCFISVPTYSLARDEQYYDNPLEFQPFRFYELRQKDAENGKQHQFASSSTSNMPWGYGKAACPGRTFAANEIKLICALLINILNMEFTGGQTQRPENVYIDERITPSKTQQIDFCRRKIN